MATDLEAVAKWHENTAATIDRPRPKSLHTEAAAAIRAAMEEIERLRAYDRRLADILTDAADAADEARYGY